MHVIHRLGLLDPSVSYSRPDLSSFGDSFLVVWEGWSVKGRFIDAKTELPPAAGEAFSISLTSPGQFASAIATDGENYLVVWIERGPFYYTPRTPQPPAAVLAARFAPDGTRLDDVPIMISPAIAVAGTPTIAFDGVNYLVAWSQQGSGIRLRRLSRGGTLLDTEASAIGPSDAAAPSIAWNGTNYLVVYSSRGSIRGARVRPNAVVDDPQGFHIASGSAPAIAWDGISYFVVWSDGDDVLGARVSPFGFRVDPEPFRIVRSRYRETLPSIAWNGAHYLVVWQSQTETTDIYGTRVASTGEILDSGYDGEGLPIATAKRHEAMPVVKWNGREFLVIWSDALAGTLHGGRITSDFRLNDHPPERGGVFIASGAGFSLATISPRSAAVSYSRHLQELTTSRVFIRTLQLERRRAAGRGR